MPSRAAPETFRRFLGSHPMMPRRQAGFTLLEILVVIVIIGIIASVAVLSIGSRALDDRLDAEARRLQELIELAADEALLQGAELAFVHTTDGYGFLTLKDARWQFADGVLRERGLAEPFYLQLRVEGRAVAPLPRGGEPDEKAELKPQVLLLSSGEATEFTLEVRAREYAPHYRIAGDALGRLKMERVGS